jgi:hypothetical protein
MIEPFMSFCVKKYGKIWITDFVWCDTKEAFRQHKPWWRILCQCNDKGPKLNFGSPSLATMLNVVELQMQDFEPGENDFVYFYHGWCKMCGRLYYSIYVGR